MFKVRMIYPDGSTEDNDELFDTEAEARQYGLDLCAERQEGGEILHMSNPGDYPDEDDDADFAVIEVDT